MATKIVTKNSSTASAVPTASDLVQGELAVNVADKRLFTEDNAGAIVELGTNPTTLNVNGTATMDGLDVDGTITAYGLNFDISDGVEINALESIVFDIDSDNNQTSRVFQVKANNSTPLFTIAEAGNVGIGASSPSDLLTIQSPASGGGNGITIKRNDNGTDQRVGAISFGNTVDSDLAQITVQTSTGNNGDGNLLFHTQPNGGSSLERMRIDSSGNVQVKGGSELRVYRGDNATYGSMKYLTGSGGLQLNDKNGDGISFVQADGATEYMRIDSSGNVGIGTSSPNAKLSVNGITTTGTAGVVNANSGDIVLQNNRALRGDNASGTGALKLIELNFPDNDIIIGDNAFSGSGKIRFYTNTTERMRIDSSGNLLVGTTTTTFSDDGIRLYEYGAIEAVRASYPVMHLNRRTTDGDIAKFYKDGATVGSIGTETGNLNINSASTGFLSTVGTRRLNWDADQLYPMVDNVYNLGHPSYRYDDIYATNGTIQTSDFNEKQDIAELSEAEQRVAVAAKGLLRKFRWKDSVAEKGDDARIHFGIIAQDLQAAFVAEGLDAGDYAMFISTTWTDEETNEEKTRMGVRYSELLAFIISAI